VGELLFFIMDYVRGKTLTQRVEDDGPLSVGEATRIMCDTARAAGFAHRQGIVHRDLKPDNVMIEEGTGRVMVMDFGLAGLYSEPPTDRREVVIGTPAFLSPEQIQGKPGDARSDVYALGVTAYYAVTGRLPFEGDTVEEVFRQHVAVVAPRLHVTGDNLDVTYARAVERCLEKNPSGRFASGDELAHELAKAPELRRVELPVALRAYVDGLNRYSVSGRGVSAVGGLVLLEMLSRLAHGDWALAAAAAGSIVVLAAGAGAVLLRATRRLFKAGHNREAMIHALSVAVERERELHLFVGGEAARHPARRARKIGYLVGGALLGLGTASSLVGGIDPFIAAPIMGAGALILGAAALIGHVKIRKRGDLPRNMWLRFWKGRGGRWAARLAARGLEPPWARLADNREPARDATSRIRVLTALATSRIEKIRQRLMVTDTAELRRSQTPSR
jgi:serine/threonine-protein kinase